MTRPVSADVEHRVFRTTVQISERAVRACPAKEVRRIVRSLVSMAVVAQTGLDQEEANRLIREGVIQIEPGSETGRFWASGGMVAVRLDGTEEPDRERLARLSGAKKKVERY